MGPRGSYDRIAARYADRFTRELDDKPFDRRFLDDFAGRVDRGGWVVDAGSGPSQIGAYLASHRCMVASLDLSFEMLRQAAALLPAAGRVQADMRRLPFRARSIAGIVAFYSVIHVPPEELDSTLHEMKRVLVIGGQLAVTVHIGTEAVHAREMLTEPVDLHFYFYETERLTGALTQAGFEDIEATEREPYAPEVEAQTRRAYVLARAR